MRFFALAALLLGLFAAGELFARRGGDALLAVAHRVNFKVALLEARGGADFVILGSSRGNDCVEPGPLGANGASIATPSSSLPTLEALAKRTAGTKGLKTAYVELSRRQMAEGFDDVESPALQTDAAQDPVGAWLAEHSALLKGRRAFAVENWGRLPALLRPQAYDGSEFFHTKWLSESFVSVTPGSAPGVMPANDAPAEQSGAEWERVSSGYTRVVEAFRARGVKVVLYGSPLAEKRRAEECDEASRRFRASVAASVSAPFFDFACSEVPAEWLTDGDEHCGALGRARFSARLAEVSSDVH